MSDDVASLPYLVRGTSASGGTEVRFLCVNMAVANAKAAELRMSQFQEVVISVARFGQEECPAMTH
jgi:hypothetical protein